MMELDVQLQPVRRGAFAVLAVALIASGPWLGWWTLLPLGLAVVAFQVADSQMRKLRRPEYALLAAWVVSELIMAASVALSGGPRCRPRPGSRFPCSLSGLASRTGASL